MSPRKFHLGLFSSAGFGGDARNWTLTTEGYDWRHPELYQDIARTCERAKFDLVFLADTLAMPEVYQGRPDFYLREGMWTPMHDPIPIMGIMAAASTKVGLVTTISTSFYPPFMAARVMATLDHLSRGRMGCNFVTSAQRIAAQNFGLDDLLDHDDRYDVADEYVDLCRRLWASWEPDALVLDRQRAVFADPSKVRPVFFEGRHYKSRGPLTVSSSPQGYPLIVSAGSSPRGQRFAAEHAELTVISKSSVADMERSSKSMRRAAEAADRPRDAIKIFGLMRTIVGETESIARERWEAKLSETTMEAGLATLSEATGHDMSQYDADQALPSDLKINALQSRLLNHSGDRPLTLREFALLEARNTGFLVFGTPDQIADQLENAASQADLDGFLLRIGIHDYTSLVEFVDRVVPVLQRRGLCRKDYGGAFLRNHVNEF